MKEISLVGESINKFIIHPIAKEHNRLVTKLFSQGRCCLIRTEDSSFPFLNARGFLDKINISFSMNSAVYNDLLADAIIQLRSTNYGVVFLDVDGYIINLSENIYDLIS
jgi:hypothetical protein